MKTFKKEKIILALLPFWAPLIPPLGIACLKSFLQKHGYEVSIYDFNINEEFRKIYRDYFMILKNCIPENKKGNFYNIGHDVLQDHMAAHMYYKSEEDYIQLVKQLAAKNFYWNIDDQAVKKLNMVIAEFYTRLEKYFFTLLEKEKADVLGLSLNRGTLPASIFAAQITRNAYPHIKIVMGGTVFSQELVPGSSNFPDFLERVPFVDKVIIGEGENLFLQYLQGKLPVSQKVYKLDDIDNEILDISCADIPDFTGIALHHYPHMAAYCSRSCPFQCSFCAETVNWGKYRKKKASRIAQELEILYNKYGSRLFLMCDSLLNPLITDLSEELIKTDISFYWDGYLRVDKHTCNLEQALLWRRGGFFRARIGVESGSQRVLDCIGKNITIQQVKSTLTNLAHLGVKTSTMWIAGHPGETEEDFQMTLDLIEELKDDIYEAECNPFRYFPAGQVNSDEWANKFKRIPLYSEKSKDMLVVQNYVMDCQPSREETFQRLNRFVRHCHRLGIPNPYSMQEIYDADERWKKLHQNAVPSLVEFENSAVCINECRTVETYAYADGNDQYEGDFEF